MQKRRVFTVLLLVMSMALTLGLAACNFSGSDDNADRLVSGEYPRRFENLITPQEQAIIDAGLAAVATPAQKKAAAITMYNVSNRSRLTTDVSLMVQDSVNVNSLNGNFMSRLDMHGFTLKSGAAWYYQLLTEVSTPNEAMDIIMSAVSGNLQVGYTLDSEDYYYAYIMGSKTKCKLNDDVFPFGTYILTEEPIKYDREGFIEQRNALDDHLEIVNYRFCEQILKDDVDIVYDEANGFYTVRFSIDVKNEDPEIKALLDEWCALAQKDQQKGAGKDSIRIYDSFEVTLEMWDNGYAKYFKGDEVWSAKAPVVGTMDFHPVNQYHYVWNQAEIMEILRSDERLDTREKLELMSPMQYIERCVGTEISEAGLTIIEQIAIGVCVPIGAALLAWIIIEILVKAGKLPKIASKRAAKKLAKKEKKAAKKAEKNGELYGYREEIDESQDDDRWDV